MAILCMVYGESGRGKTYSLRNFDPNEVAVINVSGKMLPFLSGIKTYDTANYGKIIAAMGKTERKSIVIDDASYLITDEFMGDDSTGYQKFSNMGKNFWRLIVEAQKLPDDKIVYFIGHSDVTDTGREHFKTVGKMIDNYVTPEGRFTIVLKAVLQDGNYMFATKNNGSDTTKCPPEIIDEEFIVNDLKFVDDKIREFLRKKKELEGRSKQPEVEGDVKDEAQKEI